MVGTSSTPASSQFRDSTLDTTLSRTDDQGSDFRELRCVFGAGFFLFLVGHGSGCRTRPMTETVGKSEVRYQPVLVLAALSACFLFHAYFIPLTHGSVSDIPRSSRDLETDFPPSVAVLPFHDTGTSREPLVLGSDSLVCLESEDLESLEEDPGHPQAFPEPSLIRLGEFSSHDSPRTPFLLFSRFTV